MFKITLNRGNHNVTVTSLYQGATYGIWLTGIIMVCHIMAEISQIYYPVYKQNLAKRKCIYSGPKRQPSKSCTITDTRNKVNSF